MATQQFQGRTQRGLVVSVVFVWLTACAQHNALLQSPAANNTAGIDHINAELDLAMAEPAPAPVTDDVLMALTPDLDAPASLKPAEPRFDIAVNNVPANDFFNGLVADTRQNIVVHPGVEGVISLSLKDVTVNEVLEVTREIYGYEFQQNGRLIKVYPSGPRTRVFHINYLDVQRKGGSETRVSSGQISMSGGSGGDDSDGGSSGEQSISSLGTQINTQSENRFWEQLEQTLQLITANSDSSSVVITPSAGVVVVRAESDVLSAVEDYLRNAELIMQRQVILEAKILEVELNERYQQGIDWSFSEAGEFAANGTARRSIDLAQNARTVSDLTAGGVFASTVRLGNFNTTIDLLSTQGNVQVLSSPRIATVNNQKAVIKVGSDEYFVTDIDFESNSDSNSTSTDIDLTAFFSGIALDVTPQISENGKIILHVHPTISEVVDQQKLISISGDEIDLPLALSTIRESDSVITAENGQIVVIGGLIQTRNEDENSSVPFFSEIPLIGELFKQKSELLSKTELVILLRPTITDANSINADLTRSRQRFGEFKAQMQRPPETDFYE